MEQALIQSMIPFDLIFDQHLADLSKYRVLILPQTECLSDAQLAAVRRFVEGGGGLIATGQAGLYDEWRRVRVRPGLAGLVDSQSPARGYQERVEREGAAGKAVRKLYRKGAGSPPSAAVATGSAGFDLPLPISARTNLSGAQKPRRLLIVQRPGAPNGGVRTRRVY